MHTLRRQHPDTKELELLSDDARVIVSEPLGELAGAWNEVPESYVGMVEPDGDEFCPFTPSGD